MEVVHRSIGVVVWCHKMRVTEFIYVLLILMNMLLYYTVLMTYFLPYSSLFSLKVCECIAFKDFSTDQVYTIQNICLYAQYRLSYCLHTYILLWLSTHGWFCGTVQCMGSMKKMYARRKKFIIQFVTKKYIIN